MSKGRLAAFPISVILFFLLSSCATKPKVVVTEPKKDDRVEVSSGDVFSIKLKAQLGTGFSWGFENKCAFIETFGKPAQYKVDELKPGGYEFQEFMFKAKSQGEGKIAFKYSRPWLKNEKPQKEIEIVISVK